MSRESLRTIGIRAVAAVWIITAIGGCGSVGKSITSTVTMTSAAPGSTTTADKTPTATTTAVKTPTATTPTATTTTAATAAPIEVPLYQEFEAEHSVGPNGKPVDTTLAGTDYPNSTGMWVGCSGETATTTYRLNRAFSRLQAMAGLRPHTPDGLTVDVTMTSDGRVVQHFVVGKSATVPIDLDLTGSDSFVVAAIAVDRSLCAASGTPYGALGGAMLTPS